MKSILLLIMVSSALVFSGCGKREKPTKLTGTSGRDRVTTNGAAPSNEQQQSVQKFMSYAGGWGEIGTNASDDLAYNEQLKALVSATLDPNSLGHVSPLSGQSTWVRFQLKVKLKGDSTVDSSASYIQIAIKDEYAGQTVDGVTPNLVSIAIEGGAQGRLTGDSLVVSFEDKYGQIKLDGKVNQAYNGNEYFVGTISFQNKMHYIKGEAPRSGIIGGFAITENNSITN